jgi:hypothetical protein
MVGGKLNMTISSLSPPADKCAVVFDSNTKGNQKGAKMEQREPQMGAKWMPKGDQSGAKKGTGSRKGTLCGTGTKK